MSRAVQSPTGPTYEEIRQWPAVVSVEQAALALGVSRAHAYECIKAGTFPARSIRVGGRVKVVTSSILAVLDGAAA